MEHDIISQIIPYLEYLLIFGSVAGGIICAVKFIHRKGVIHGVDTIRGEAIQKDLCALKKEFEEDKKNEAETHRVFFKKIDVNTDSLNRIGKEIASIKATVDLLTNFIMNHKRLGKV